jgi:hypothetical protein
MKYCQYARAWLVIPHVVLCCVAAILLSFLTRLHTFDSWIHELPPHDRSGYRRSQTPLHNPGIAFLRTSLHLPSCSIHLIDANKLRNLMLFHDHLIY